MTNAVVTDPIQDSKLRREGDFDKLWAEMGQEFKQMLKDWDGEQWVNLNLTVDDDPYQFNRTIALT